MKNKEKYDLNKLTICIHNEWLELLMNNEELFRSRYESYIELTSNLLSWLEQEYIEPVTLTEDEKVILRNINKDYKYIVRDDDNEDNLYIFRDMPYRSNNHWISKIGYHAFNEFEHLFQFIKWEDEPYNIDELLKMNGVER